MYHESYRQQPRQSSEDQYNLLVQNAEQDDGEAYKIHAVPLQKEKHPKTFTRLPSDQDGQLGLNPTISTPYDGSLREELDSGETDHVFI